LTTSPRRPTPASRATRRSRRPEPRSATFLQRNRSRLLWGAGAVGFVILAGLAFLSFSAPTYACANVFDPSPAPSQAASPTQAPSASDAPAPSAPPPGFVQPDMGHLHVPIGEKVRYSNCPPASGRHYQAPAGPIRGGVYGPNDVNVPQGWIHNLEHGAIVLLYKCPGDACTEQGQAALQALFARWPASPICKTAPGQVTPVITRFDDMASAYTALVWDVVLPLDTLDENLLFEFYARQGEQFNPEKQCPTPTATPVPAPTAGPPTAGPPSASPAVSPAASPAAAPTGSAAPAASTAPAPG
jgi:hypothetical protein